MQKQKPEPKHLFGISGEEEYLALKQLAKEEKRNSHPKKRSEMTEEELEDYLQGIGEL